MFYWSSKTIWRPQPWIYEVGVDRIPSKNIKPRSHRLICRALSSLIFSFTFPLPWYSPAVNLKSWIWKNLLWSCEHLFVEILVGFDTGKSFALLSCMISCMSNCVMSLHCQDNLFWVFFEWMERVDVVKSLLDSAQRHLALRDAQINWWGWAGRLRQISVCAWSLVHNFPTITGWVLMAFNL